MDIEVKVMMVFVVFAVIVGVISGVAELTGYQGLLLALVFFYISYRVGPRVFKDEEGIEDLGRGDIIKTAIIPYWFLWLVLWTLTYTLMI